jgi:hypothetical protein
MRFNPILIFSIIITCAAVALMVIHLFYSTIAIDIITITLFIIAIIPWAGQIFQSVKLPGGIEFVYRELSQVSEKLAEENLVAEPTAETEYFIDNRMDSVYRLAILRVEIERRLRALARMYDIDVNRARGIGGLTVQLHRVKALSLGEIEVLRQISRILNMAVHGGEQIEEAVAAWALDEGPRLIAGLDKRISQRATAAM